MANCNSADIRNIALIGHGSGGKTTLLECALFRSKGSDRFGKVTDGTTVSDYDPEEIKRGFSIAASLAPVSYAGKKINVIDTPGFLDFSGEVFQALRVVDAALIVVNAKAGLEVGADGSFSETAVPESEKANLASYQDMLFEALAETNEDMMNKYFGGEKFTKDEIHAGLHDGILSGSILPVFCGSALTGAGVDYLFQAIADFFPSPLVRNTEQDPEGKPIEIKDDTPTSLFVFKTVADPFVGKMNYFKVLIVILIG